MSNTSKQFSFFSSKLIVALLVALLGFFLLLVLVLDSENQLHFSQELKVH